MPRPLLLLLHILLPLALSQSTPELSSTLVPITRPGYLLGPRSLALSSAGNIFLATNADGPFAQPATVAITASSASPTLLNFLYNADPFLSDRSYATGIRVASSNLFITGFTGFNEALPGQTNKGQRDYFLAIVAATNGALRTLVQDGTAGSDGAYDIAIGDGGSSYVAGIAGVSSDVVGDFSKIWGDSAVSGGAMLVKYNSGGERVWAYVFGDSFQDRAEAVALYGNSEFIYVGGTKVVDSVEGVRIFKLRQNIENADDIALTVEWVRESDDSNPNVFRAMAIDTSSGDVFIASELNLASLQGRSLSLAKYSKEGNLVFEDNRVCCSEGSQAFVGSLSVGIDRNLYIGGTEQLGDNHFDFLLILNRFGVSIIRESLVGSYTESSKQPRGGGIDSQGRFRLSSADVDNSAVRILTATIPGYGPFVAEPIVSSTTIYFKLETDRQNNEPADAVALQFQQVIANAIQVEYAQIESTASLIAFQTVVVTQHYATVRSDQSSDKFNAIGNAIEGSFGRSSYLEQTTNRVVTVRTQATIVQAPPEPTDNTTGGGDGGGEGGDSGTSPPPPVEDPVSDNTIIIIAVVAGVAVAIIIAGILVFFTIIRPRLQKVEFAAENDAELY